MNRFVERRLAYWPNAQTRAEAARLFYVERWGLGKVLALYPNEVISKYKNEPRRGAARRAIWAHWALTQEAVGEPDIDPDDAAAVARVVREEGAMVAACRTGDPLSQYNTTFPDLDWYKLQAPPSWPVDVDVDVEFEDAGRGQREQAGIRSAVCPECFCIHAGECR